MSFKQIVINLFAGTTTGLVTLAYSISFAALIFSGVLAPYFSQGVTSALISSLITGIFVSYFSKLKFVIAGPDSNSAAILALMVYDITEQVSAKDSVEVNTLPTVWAAIALSSILTGLVLYLIGKSKSARWARFIPYTVMGGFLAGTGWLITRSSFKVMAGVPLEWNKLSYLFQEDILIHWLPGLIFSVATIIATKYIRHVLTMPVMLLLTIILFDLFWLFISDTVHSSQGWFLESMPNHNSWNFWISTVPQVNWQVLLNESGTLFAMVIVVLIAILLNAIGIEIAVQHDCNLDHELCVNGIANIFTGLCGGMVGHLSLNRSLLNQSAGANSRVAGLTTAAFCGFILIFGSSIFTYIPRFVLGGLLLTIGFKLLHEWVYSAWFKFPRLEYAIIIVILAITTIWGFIAGVGIGIIISCALFAFNYSRYQIVRNTLEGTTYKSKVQRQRAEQRLLKQKGDQIYILLLQGYIFFGRANTLLEQIQLRLKNIDLPTIEFLILDFRLVNGLDSSIVLSFLKIQQLANKYNFNIILTHVHSNILQQLTLGGCINHNDTSIQILPDLDRGIEYCENKIIEKYSLKLPGILPLALQFNKIFNDTNQVKCFMSYLERVQVNANQILFTQNQASNTLCFIESGQITTFLQLDDGQTRRLQTSGAGTIIGETAFYLSTSYKTSAIADQDSKIYHLTKMNLYKMQQENPQVSVVFQEFLIRQLSERLIYAYSEIEELL
ncbi:sulfate permease [Dulcicalothrix desertica PCC 7102]|uniref:Sulfate permease n=1 Tax=Dulcicalothrix desertica PCC 7102 TaxID=232991 RepID=A0A3S1BBK6_9CYAN|nr:sulfate permease [Dulcicalothrix desertica PCC 7102]